MRMEDFTAWADREGCTLDTQHQENKIQAALGCKYLDRIKARVGNTEQLLLH